MQTYGLISYFSPGRVYPRSRLRESYRFRNRRRFVFPPAAVVEKSGSDSAAVSESAYTLTIPVTDSVGLAEAYTLAIGGASDSSTLTETGSPALTVADSAALAESALIALAGIDSGSAAEAYQLSIAAADSGSITESGSVVEGAFVFASDAMALSEGVTLSASLAATDLATLTETGTVPGLAALAFSRIYGAVPVHRINGYPF